MSENLEKIENPEVATAKELFEYEMTEVLLMLKGEFTSISGKDMLKEGDAFVDEEKLRIPDVVFADADITPPDVKIPETKAFTPLTIPEPAIETKAAETAVFEEIKKPEPVQLEEAVIKPVQVKLPEIPVINAWKPVTPLKASTDERSPAWDIEVPAGHVDLSKLAASEKKFVSIPDLQTAESRINNAKDAMAVNIAQNEKVSVAVKMPELPDTDVSVNAHAAVEGGTEIKVPADVRVDLSALNTVKTPADVRVNVPSVPAETGWQLNSELPGADAQNIRTDAAVDLDALQKATDYKAEIRKIPVADVKDFSFEIKFTPKPKNQEKPASVIAAEKALAESKTVFTYEDIMN